MNKTAQWPQWKKDQFNQEVKKLKTQKHRREALLDARYCPAIWTFPLNEQNVFTTLAYSFPFNHIIIRILRQFYSHTGPSELLLSSRYLYLTRKVIPSYYSEREQIVVMLNRYLINQDMDEFMRWLPFNQSRRFNHLIDLMLGVFALDVYLQDLQKIEYLHLALRHLVKGRGRFVSKRAKLAFTSLIAFCHYMNKDFHESMGCLEFKLQDDFQQKFNELIVKNKVA